MCVRSGENQARDSVGAGSLPYENLCISMLDLWKRSIMSGWRMSSDCQHDKQ